MAALALLACLGSSGGLLVRPASGGPRAEPPSGPAAPKELSPTLVWHALWQAAKEGRREAVLACFSKEAQARIAEIDAFVAYHASALPEHMKAVTVVGLLSERAKDPKTRLRVTQERVEGDKATLEIASNAGPETVPFIREEGAWKIAAGHPQLASLRAQLEEAVRAKPKPPPPPPGAPRAREAPTQLSVVKEPPRPASPGERQSQPALPAPIPALAGWPFDEAEAKRGQEETSRALGLPLREEIDLGPGGKIPLVLIPAGEFVMGDTLTPEEVARRWPPADPQWHRVARPRHRVRLTRPFYLGESEIPRGAFAEFVRDAGYKTDAEKAGRGYDARDREGRPREGLSWRDPGFPQTDLHPVAAVSWNDALAFCDWLSRRAGRRYSLPTEAQWEYACRAGSDALWPWGDREEDAQGRANVAGEDEDWPHPFKGVRDGARASTAVAGSFAPNAFGLRDMIGSLWEWCSDWYGATDYAASAPSDPPGPAAGSTRVLRGGGWDGPPWECRSAVRFCGDTSVAAANYGFRMARTVEVWAERPEMAAASGPQAVARPESRRVPAPPVPAVASAAPQRPLLPEPWVEPPRPEEVDPRLVVPPPPPADPPLPPGARHLRVDCIRYEHGKSVRGRTGMMVCAKIAVRGLPLRTLQVIMRLRFPSGPFVKAARGNRRFSDMKGRFAVVAPDTTRLREGLWNECSAFVPYDALDLPRGQPHPLMLVVTAECGDLRDTREVTCTIPMP